MSTGTSCLLVLAVDYCSSFLQHVAKIAAQAAVDSLPKRTLSSSHQNVNSEQCSIFLAQGRLEPATRANARRRSCCQNTDTICIMVVGAPLDLKQLKGLDAHKYSCSGRSAVEPLLQIYWNWLVEFVPLWIAPNAITAAGLFLNIISSVVIFLYSPHATEAVSLWKSVLARYSCIRKCVHAAVTASYWSLFVVWWLYWNRSLSAFFACVCVRKNPFRGWEWEK